MSTKTESVQYFALLWWHNWVEAGDFSTFDMSDVLFSMFSMLNIDFLIYNLISLSGMYIIFDTLL